VRGRLGYELEDPAVVVGSFLLLLCFATVTVTVTCFYRRTSLEGTNRVN
jgi:hypothetical protein